FQAEDGIRDRNVTGVQTCALPILGGIKDKMLAAMRAGIRRVMLPARNSRDLEEVPAEAKQKMEFVFLEDVDEAVRVALEPRPEKIGRASCRERGEGEGSVGAR